MFFVKFVNSLVGFAQLSTDANKFCMAPRRTCNFSMAFSMGSYAENASYAYANLYIFKISIIKAKICKGRHSYAEVPLYY